ncbi:MAG: HAMP domain-containing sensor histidine kinase [Aeromicrobium sp.]
MNPTPSSLRGRLVLGGVIVGIVFATLFGLTASWRVHDAADQAVHAALQSRLELARDEIAADGSIRQDAGSPKTDLVQVLGPDGKIRSSSPALAGVRPLISVTAIRELSGRAESRIALQHPDIDLAVLAVPLTLTQRGDSPTGTGTLLVAADTEGFNSASSDLLDVLIVGLVAVVLAIAALSWFLTGRALRSVTRIAESAESVGPRDLGSGIPVPEGDVELARLVEALNRMLTRLHRSHTSELAFAADAGHRLRTPVATLRAEAELALRETDPAQLTAALERVVQDADQLTSIVDRMLARSRSHDVPAGPVLRAISDASSRWHRQASLADVDLANRVDVRVSPTASCTELAEILDPIVDNAIRHTPAGGQVTIDVNLDTADSDTLTIAISNTGPPISPELAPYVFDAWVSGRDASIAGGLGLWLARETARDLGGEVELLDHRGPTTFLVRLPCSDGPCSDGH